MHPKKRWRDTRSFLQSNLFLYVNSYGFRALQFYPRAMAGHVSGGRWAGPGGRRAWPGGKVTTGEEPRGAEASGERHAPQRVATLSFELYSFFVF